MREYSLQQWQFTLAQRESCAIAPGHSLPTQSPSFRRRSGRGDSLAWQIAEIAFDYSKSTRLLEDGKTKLNRSFSTPPMPGCSPTFRSSSSCVNCRLHITS